MVFTIYFAKIPSRLQNWEVMPGLRPQYYNHMALAYFIWTGANRRNERRSIKRLVKRLRAIVDCHGPVATRWAPHGYGLRLAKPVPMFELLQREIAERFYAQWRTLHVSNRGVWY